MEAKVEYTGRTCVIHDVVALLPRGPGAYRPRRDIIEEVVFHQTAGGTQPGLRGPQNTATFHTAEPVYAKNPNGTLRLSRKGKRILVGGGRGWPGIAYHLFIPWMLEHDAHGRAVVYRTQPDGSVSFHTGGAATRRGIGVVFQGYFETRHTPQPEVQPGPTREHLDVAYEVATYLCAKYGMQLPESLKGHFDYSKPSCPGDVAEQWIRGARGDVSEVPTRPGRQVPGRFTTWADRERALWLVGMMPELPDGKFDFKTRAAIERLQTTAEIVVDGIWGPQTDGAAHRALVDVGINWKDPGAQPRLWDG